MKTALHTLIIATAIIGTQPSKASASTYVWSRRADEAARNITRVHRGETVDIAKGFAFSAVLFGAAYKAKKANKARPTNSLMFLETGLALGGIAAFSSATYLTIAKNYKQENFVSGLTDDEVIVGPVSQSIFNATLNAFPSESSALQFHKDYYSIVQQTSLSKIVPKISTYLLKQIASDEPPANAINESCLRAYENIIDAIQTDPVISISRWTRDFERFFAETDGKIVFNKYCTREFLKSSLVEPSVD